MTETVRRVRRPPAWLGWTLCVVLGAAFGGVCWVPLIWTYLAARVVAQDAGWAPFDGTFDEGAGLWVGSAVVLWAVFGLVAGGVTWLVRRWTQLPAWPWWWVTALLWLAPFVVLYVPDLP